MITKPGFYSDVFYSEADGYLYGVYLNWPITTNVTVINLSTLQEITLPTAPSAPLYIRGCADPFTGVEYFVGQGSIGLLFWDGKWEAPATPCFGQYGAGICFDNVSKAVIVYTMLDGFNFRRISYYPLSYTYTDYKISDVCSLTQGTSQGWLSVDPDITKLRWTDLDRILQTPNQTLVLPQTAEGVTIGQGGTKANPIISGVDSTEKDFVAFQSPGYEPHIVGDGNGNFACSIRQPNGLCSFVLIPPFNYFNPQGPEELPEVVIDPLPRKYWNVGFHVTSNHGSYPSNKDSTPVPFDAEVLELHYGDSKLQKQVLAFWHRNFDGVDYFPYDSTPKDKLLGGYVSPEGNNWMESYIELEKRCYRDGKPLVFNYDGRWAETGNQFDFLKSARCKIIPSVELYPIDGIDSIEEISEKWSEDTQFLERNGYQELAFILAFYDQHAPMSKILSLLEEAQNVLGDTDLMILYFSWARATGILDNKETLLPVVHQYLNAQEGSLPVIDSPTPPVIPPTKPPVNPNPETPKMKTDAEYNAFLDNTMVPALTMNGVVNAAGLSREVGGNFRSVTKWGNKARDPQVIEYEFLCNLLFHAGLSGQNIGPMMDELVKECLQQN